MEKVTLGRSGLKVSPIAFGTWQLSGDWGEFDQQEAIDAIRFAHERGVNFFDTAQAYGFGASERMLGEALRGIPRDEVLIATKGGLRLDEERGLLRDSSPGWLRRGVDQSLQALGTDHIDLYQVHWPDPHVPFAETAAVLEQMVQEGKILHVGASNFDPDQMSEFSRTRPIETLQPPYSLFNRDIEAGILPYCEEHNIGVLVYGPLAHGLLTGTMTPETLFAQDDWRRVSPSLTGETFRANLDVVEDLRQLAQDQGWTVSQLAIAWALSHPAVDVAIVGSRSRKHIQESLGASEIELTAHVRADVERILAAAAPVEEATPETMTELMGLA